MFLADKMLIFVSQLVANFDCHLVQGRWLVRAFSLNTEVNESRTRESNI